MRVIELIDLKSNELGETVQVTELIEGRVVKIVFDRGEAFRNAEFNIKDEFGLIATVTLNKDVTIIHPRVPVYSDDQMPLVSGGNEMMAPIVAGHLYFEGRNLGPNNLLKRIQIVCE